MYSLVITVANGATFENFKTMYNLVYGAMELVDVAKKLPESQW